MNSNANLCFLRRTAAALLVLAALAGCHQDMWNQPKYRGLRPSEFFTDGAAARPVIAGVVPYAAQRREWTSPVFERIAGNPLVPEATDDLFYTGLVNGTPSAENYFPISKELLERGRERFELTCTPCHGFLGNGDGVVVRRGFPAPPSYHIPRLLEVEDGYIFDVITRGFGRMYSYAARVQPEDRWAIAAYIRALQLSQNVNIDALAPTDRQRVEKLVNEAAHAPQPQEDTPHAH